MPRFINHATDEKYSHIKELRALVPQWQNISIPVTVVQGGADKIVNPANFDFAKAQLKSKQADFIFLPNAGHLIRWQRPDVVKSILLKVGSPESGVGSSSNNSSLINRK